MVLITRVIGLSNMNKHHVNLWAPKNCMKSHRKPSHRSDVQPWRCSFNRDGFLRGAGDMFCSDFFCGCCAELITWSRGNFTRDHWVVTCGDGDPRDPRDPRGPFSMGLEWLSNILGLTTQKHLFGGKQLVTLPSIYLWDGWETRSVASNGSPLNREYIGNT